jgi:hypothetical protein
MGCNCHGGNCYFLASGYLHSKRSDDFLQVREEERWSERQVKKKKCQGWGTGGTGSNSLLSLSMSVARWRFCLPSAGKQCWVRGDVRSRVPHWAGGAGWDQVDVM